jgi:NADH-quinone oxidoreductase subunit L
VVSASLAFLAPSFPAGAFFIILFFGRWLPARGAFLAPLSVAGSLGVFFAVLAGLLDKGGGDFAIVWFSIGEAGSATQSTFTWGTLVDPLSVVMLGLVAFIALTVQVYSWGYMRDEHGNPDPRFGWYFAVHSLFAAAMMALVLADNLILAYIAWELVGLGSYLLIGFWWERRSAAEAAKKAFVTTRIGDVGFLIGIILLFKATGSFSITSIASAAEAGAINQTTLNWSMLLIFLGAMGKSAQVPFHVWLPDAMEGPTPVSALIHAATMVAAGVYLVARLFPIYEAAPLVLTVVAAVGLTTALVGALMALVQTDLKRVLVYSTVSHLGFMMLALGAGSLGAAMFHLLAHAFAKAALFLGAGAITHATHETDITKMGGLASKMRVTAVAFSIAAVSLAGLPPLAGFFSKDEVLLAVADGRLNSGFLAGAFIAVIVSALYTGRLLILVFGGKARNADAAEHAHEAPLLLLGPVALLASIGAVAGLLAFGWTHDYEGFGAFLTRGHEHGFRLEPWISIVSVLAVLGAFWVARDLYWVGIARRGGRVAVRREAASGTTGPRPGRRAAARAARIAAAASGRRTTREPIFERVAETLAPVHTALENKLYFDIAYQWCVDRVMVTFAQVVGLFDRAVVNDRGIEGNATTVRDAGGVLRYLQSGMVYNYALGMVVGAVVVAILWWVV